MASVAVLDFTALLRRLRRLRAAGPGVAMMLHGPPGIGKSYAAQRLARESGLPQLTVQATADLTSLLQAFSFSVRPDPGDYRVDAPISQSLDALSLHLHGLLARRAPLVLIVEDLHEAPPERQTLWLTLAGRVSRSRGLALLVTGRTTLHEIDSGEIQPLASHESAGLLDELARGPLPETATAWMQQRSGGNPLYLHEFFRWLRAHGALWDDGHRWQWRVPQAEQLPDTLSALIAQQLRAASRRSETRALLLACALCPDASDPAELAALAGQPLEALPASIRPVLNAGILGERGFTHPLLREVALTALPADERRTVARRAVTLLSPVRAAALLPWAELPPRQGAALLLRAARAERGLGHWTGAARLFLAAARQGTLAERPWPLRVALSALGHLRLTDLRTCEWPARERRGSWPSHRRTLMC